MNKNTLRLGILGCAVIALLLALPSYAQDAMTCPDIVLEAVAAVGELCNETGRNQACYGNRTISAEPQSGVTDLVFEFPGDIDDVAKVISLTLSGMDEGVPEWGISLMRLQANLPDTLPGQNVTVLLFGDVLIENAVGDEPAVFLEVTASGSINVRSGPSTRYAIAGTLGAGDTAMVDGRNEVGDWLRVQFEDDQVGWVYAPLLTVEGDVTALPVIDADEAEPVIGYTSMQAFYFRSGVGDTACVEAPESGTLIQTPEGAGEVNFRVNGVDITLASTVFLQAQPEGEMSINVIEGRAEVTAFDETRIVLAGARVRVPLDADLEASGPPGNPEPYEEARLAALPLGGLDREIVIAPAALVGDVPLAGQWRIIEETCHQDRIGIIDSLTVENDGEAFVIDGRFRYDRVEPGVYFYDMALSEWTVRVISPVYLEWTGSGVVDGCFIAKELVSEGGE